MTREHRRSGEAKVLRYSLAVLAALVLVGGGLLASSLWLGAPDDDPATAVPSTPEPSPTARVPLSPSPSPSATPKSKLTGPKMTAFIRRYLATAPRHQAVSWRLLTPPFQRASGGFDSYQSFWGPITSAQASGISADPGQRRIAYHVRYTYPDGHVFVDDTRLLLRLTPGGIRIAGEG